MRHIITSFQITCLLKGCQGRSYSRFYIRNGIIPTCRSCNLQSRTVYSHSLSCHLLDSLPYLVYFTETQFGLIDKNKMFIQVGIVIKYETSGLEIRISTSSTGLLHIVLQRIGNIIMHYQSHITFIHTHAKSRSGNNDANLIGHKGILIGNFIIGIHLSMKRKSLKSVASKLFRNINSAFSARHIYNSRAIIISYQRPQFRIFIIIGFGMDNGISQISSGSGRGK